MTETLKNIALTGHGNSGKTSLAEVMLFKAGITTRLGRIEDKNTVMDFEPEELDRGNSISTGIHSFQRNKTMVTVLDTPGDQNFFTDTKMCMQAADSAVLVIDAIDGVKVQTEQAVDFAEEFAMPCMIFINKLDRERADFKRTFDEAAELIKPKPIITQLPVGREQDFSGVLDLITKKAYTWDKDGKLEAGEIPASMKEEFDSALEAFIEDIAEADDELIERYLEGEDLADEDIKNALKQGIRSRTFAPMLCGSAVANSGIGIELLMDFMANNMPSMADCARKKAVDSKTSETVEVEPDPEAPFSGFVFKTIADPYAGRLNIFKVVSGELGGDGNFRNSTKGSKERYNQLLTIAGKEQKPVQKAGPGAIVAVAKLKSTATGDTLCDDSLDIAFGAAEPIPPLISFAVSAKSKGDEDKIFTSLSKLLEEDMGIKLERSQETKEIILSGCGQVHIEATLEKLRRKFNVEALLEIPKIPYRETIKKKVRVQGKHKKQSGGHGQYGDCWVRMEPMPKGGGFEFVDAIVGGSIPKTYIPAVEKGIVEAAANGVLAGFPCIDFKATVDDGTYHSVDSSEMAFKIAGTLAFKKGAEEANAVLLEPIMKITITTPDEYMGDIMGDLNGKRGRVLGMDSKGKNQIIMANVPLTEFQTYAPDLRSMTGGRGIFTMEFSHYDEVPVQEAQKIIEEIKKAREIDK